jgi:O-antigen ligase
LKKHSSRLLRPFRASMSDFDSWWTGYSISIPGIAGSLLSFLYFGAGIWAVISVGLRRFPLDISGPSKWFVYSCIGYALTVLASSVLNDGVQGILPGLAAGAAFYFVPFLISRYRASDPNRSFDVLCQYAPLGAFLCLIPAIYQKFLMSIPVEGGAGNASAFGFVAAVLGTISLAEGLSPIRMKRISAFTGYLSGMGALLLSQTRALYPAILIAPVVLVFLSAGLSARTRFRIVGFFMLAVIAAVAVLWRQLEKEFMRTVGEISQIGGEVFVSSLGIRIELWKAALPTIIESPWLGHGQIHKMDGTISRLPDIISYASFTHAHNIWVDSALSGGVILTIIMTLVLVTPLNLISFKSTASTSMKRNYIVTTIFLISLLNGIVNTMFTHDIISSLYFIILILISSIVEINDNSSIDL